MNYKVNVVIEKETITATLPFCRWRTARETALKNWIISEKLLNSTWKPCQEEEETEASLVKEILTTC